MKSRGDESRTMSPLKLHHNSLCLDSKIIADKPERPIWSVSRMLILGWKGAPSVFSAFCNPRFSRVMWPGSH